MLSLRAAAIFPLITLLWGCGPVLSMSTISQATLALDSAQASGAPEKAIYQYTLGVRLINKAWEEHGYANYQRSAQFAGQAKEALELATKDAGRAVELPVSAPEEIEGSEPDGSGDGDSERWGS